LSRQRTAAGYWRDRLAGVEAGLHGGDELRAGVDVQAVGLEQLPVRLFDLGLQVGGDLG